MLVRRWEGVTRSSRSCIGSHVTYVVGVKYVISGHLRRDGTTVFVAVVSAIERSIVYFLAQGIPSPQVFELTQRNDKHTLEFCTIAWFIMF